MYKWVTSKKRKVITTQFEYTVLSKDVWQVIYNLLPWPEQIFCGMTNKYFYRLYKNIKVRIRLKLMHCLQSFAPENMYPRNSLLSWRPQSCRVLYTMNYNSSIFIPHNRLTLKLYKQEGFRNETRFHTDTVKGLTEHYPGCLIRYMAIIGVFRPNTLSELFCIKCEYCCC